MTFRHICIPAIALAVSACFSGRLRKRIGCPQDIVGGQSGDTYVGTMAHQRGARGGSAHCTIDGQDCESRYSIPRYPQGEWEIACGEGGLSAKGQFKALGGGGGAVRGTGVDSLAPLGDDLRRRDGGLT